MLNLLLGRALWRWLERLGEDRGDLQPTSESSPTGAPIRAAETPVAAEPVFPSVRRHAMGCLFEIYLAGSDREALLAAGEAALDEIERLDRQLSHYRDDSDVARLNAHAAAQWVRVEPRMYALLKRCHALTMATDGAFDVTAGPLVKAWGFYHGEGNLPSEAELAELMQSVGTYRILFDDDDHMVYFTAPRLEIDLGAIGKGYAIDCAADTLRIYGVHNAVIHGGQSTIYALGTSPTGGVAVGKCGSMGVWESGSGAEEAPGNAAQPSTINHQLSTSPGWHFVIRDPRDRKTEVDTASLENEALSTSATYEQFFETDGVRYGHILDPFTGKPAQSGLLSVSVIAPTAEESDALSTAFFVMGRADTEEYCRTHPNIRVILLAERSDGALAVTRIGF